MKTENKHESIKISIAVLDELDSLRDENKKLKAALGACKNDYFIMTKILSNSDFENFSSIKDCIERMNFRKPLFKEIK